MASAVPLIGIASPLLVIPAVTSVGGARGWAAVAVGQSIGAFAAVIVEFGWGLDGPQRVSRMSSIAARRFYAASIPPRLALYVGLLALLIVGVPLIERGDPVLATLTAAGSCLTGLSSFWFFVGRRRVAQFVAFDAIPRLLLSVTSAFVVQWSDQLLWYPVLSLIVPSAVSLFLSVVIVRVDRTWFIRMGSRRSLFLLHAMSNAVSARILSSLYITLPVSLLAIVGPASVPTFAAADRLSRMLLAALSVFNVMLQPFVGELPTRRQRYGRLKQASFLTLLLASGSAVVVFMSFGYLAEIVFSGTISLGPTESLLCAGLVFLTVVSRTTGSVGLIAMNGVKHIRSSAIVGAVVGIPAVMIAGSLDGATGALAALLFAELCVFAWQAAALLRITSDLRTNPREEE